MSAAPCSKRQIERMHDQDQADPNPSFRRLACRNWRQGFSVGDVRIQFVEARFDWGFKTVSRHGVELRVTDRERTLVDLCDRPV